MNIFTYFRIKICTQSTLILRNRSANQEYKLVVFNLWKIKAFVFSPWNASAFYSFTAMVVILQVYMKLLLWYKPSSRPQNFKIRSHSIKGTLVTLWTRHLVLKYILVYLLIIVNWGKIFCAITRCNTGIHERKIIN